MLPLMCAAVTAARFPIITPVNVSGMFLFALGCSSLTLVPAQVDRFQSSSLGAGAVSTPLPMLPLVSAAAAAARLPIATTGVFGLP